MRKKSSGLSKEEWRCEKGLFFSYRLFENHLFYYLIPVIHETVDEIDCVYFSIADDLSMIHVDLATGEEELIKFE